MSKAKFKDFYKNSYDWDRTYFECGCGSHIMHLTFLSNDCELIIGSIGADDEFSFYKGKELNKFYQELNKIYHNITSSYYFNKDDLKLTIYYDADLYWFELKPTIGDDNYWDICLNKDQVENLLLLLRDRLQKWLEKECAIKTKEILLGFKLHVEELKKQGLSEKEIAEFLHISPPSVATSLKRMEESGLVVRVENKKDARRNSIKLTKKGKELVEYADNLFLRIDDVAYRGFSQEEMDTLTSFLERMNDNLKAFAKEDDNA